jgi:hypothetical protein
MYIVIRFYSLQKSLETIFIFFSTILHLSLLMLIHLVVLVAFQWIYRFRQFSDLPYMRLSSISELFLCCYFMRKSV